MSIPPYILKKRLLERIEEFGSLFMLYEDQKHEERLKNQKVLLSSNITKNRMKTVGHAALIVFGQFMATQMSGQRWFSKRAKLVIDAADLEARMTQLTSEIETLTAKRALAPAEEHFDYNQSILEKTTQSMVIRKRHGVILSLIDKHDFKRSKGAEELDPGIVTNIEIIRTWLKKRSGLPQVEIKKPEMAKIDFSPNSDIGKILANVKQSIEDEVRTQQITKIVEKPLKKGEIRPVIKTDPFMDILTMNWDLKTTENPTEIEENIEDETTN